VKIGDEITIEPAALVAGGAAIARVDGFPIFAMNVYPGDVAVVRLTEVKKGFARADLARLVTPSRLRRAMPCPIAEECGGCDWTALRLDAQLDAKKAILVESLRRIGKIHEHPPVTVHPSPLNYRIRSRLHREGDAVGFFAMRSNRVVPLVKECEVVGIETAARDRRPATEIWEIDGRLIADGEMMIEGYYVTTEAFFQVNRHLLQTMLRLVRSHAERVTNRRRAIDLYAGVGFFTVPLASLFDTVMAVEGAGESYECAKRNVPANVKLVNKPVEEYGIPEADFIFLDPPRAGTTKSVVDAIARNAREMVCYLSCDPVTFSRDASRLIASGWRLATLDLLDLFPNTHHVETLSSFERVS
jgi:23S rRNA (uracil1939-C5)-methyltransferase